MCVICFIDVIHQCMHAEKVVKHHKDMIESISRGSKFLDELSNAFDKDADYEVIKFISEC